MSRTKNITEIDKAMAFKEQTLDGMNWYSVDSEGFVLDGLYWRKKGGAFRRLPLNLSISENVDKVVRIKSTKDSTSSVVKFP